MSLEEKLSRIRKISQIRFPSDQEIKEKERLEEEVQLIYNEETNTNPFKEKTITLGQGNGYIIKSKVQKKSIIEIILSKVKSKPATWEEIQQLKLEKIKATLKKDIAVAKYRTKNPGGKDRKSSRNNDTMKFFSSSKESRSKPQDFKSMMGTNNSKKYKGLTG